jgi:hypothetical protein
MDMFDICGFLGSSVQRYAVEDKAEFSRMKNKTVRVLLRTNTALRDPF